MGRGPKILVVALGLSLAVHVALLTTAGRGWEGFLGDAFEEVAQPLEARLIEPPPAPAIATPSPTPPKRSVFRRAMPAPRAKSLVADVPQAVAMADASEEGPREAPVAPVDVEADPATLASSDQIQPGDGLAQPPQGEAPPSDADKTADTPQPETPGELAQTSDPDADATHDKSSKTPTGETHRVRELPDQLTLVYNVLAGEGGFNLGQASYTWKVEGDRYSLESFAEAKGLVSLFMTGRIRQSSQGRIGSSGLVPETFEQSKKEGRQDTARFDWKSKQLHLAKGEQPLTVGTQDLLSFPFHLAMTVMEGEAELRMPVTNGRKVKDYLFRVLPPEELKVGGTNMKTLHVHGSREGEGNLDVWLAPDRHWLPVRIRTLDQKGKQVEMVLVP